ncbi:hypothetical protein SKAU_G00298750 [Synaphobranchus kaupii]|uniref:Uncharacterized protein n=1 Tax=Synaphobranchus kaupii TaxID=118154 RepID=A0A9Q1EV63_SYNKA|nr:hypothetical protein SKAU_G00298750 [Synaphobranchus kaupii]
MQFQRTAQFDVGPMRDQLGGRGTMSAEQLHVPAAEARDPYSTPPVGGTAEHLSRKRTPVPDLILMR